MNDGPPGCATESRGLPTSIQRFMAILLILTLGCILVEICAVRLFHLPYPYDWPFLARGDPFRDLHLYRTRFAFFHTPQFFTFSGPPYLYPAPPAVFYRFFYYFPRSTVTFLLAYLAAVLLGAACFVQALRARQLSYPSALGLTALVLCCSFPLTFEYRQANLEWIVCAFVTLGIFAFLQQRGYTAAACFGIAAAMKIYPLLFLALLLSRRQYRHLVAGLMVAALTTLASLWLVCPDLTVSWHGTQQGIADFRTLYMLRYSQIQFDHGLFALLKAILRDASPSAPPPGPEVLTPLLNLYLPIAAILGVALYFARIRRLPMVNQVLALTVASILLPPVSYDYTLIHLYAPWALLVFFAVESRASIASGLSATLVCFAILFAPESEFILHGQPYGGQIEALTLVILMFLALRHRFPSSFDAPPSAKLIPAP